MARRWDAKMGSYSRSPATLPSRIRGRVNQPRKTPLLAPLLVTPLKAASHQPTIASQSHPTKNRALPPTHFISSGSIPHSSRPGRGLDKRETLPLSLAPNRLVETLQRS
jgi:hypothetical protein